MESVSSPASISSSFPTSGLRKKRGKMAIKDHFLQAFRLLIFTSMAATTISHHYKVGDLDSWGIPPSVNPSLYTKWSKYHDLKIGDSILFLYPPSQDSVIQVSSQSYNGCNLADPIVYMNDGNSLFNITSYGDLYFTSGEAGHCEKKQKLHISVLSGNGSESSSSEAPQISPSYPTVFGSIPLGPSASPSSSPQVHSLSVTLSALAGFAFVFIF